MDLRSTFSRVIGLSVMLLLSGLIPACQGGIVPADLEEGSSGQTPLALLGAESSTCEARDVSTLQACAARLRDPGARIRAIHVTAMIHCAGADACRINLDGLRGITIYGEPDWSTGFLRTSHQAGYAIVDASLNSAPAEVEVRDLVFDEGAETHDPAAWTQLAMPLRILDGEQVVLRHLLIRNFNERAMWINGVEGLTLERSRVENGQHLGVVIGSADIGGGGYEPSNHVTIRDNVFYRAGLNALVLNGVRGAAFEDNLIVNNLFDRAHFHGLYDGAAGIAGNVHGGGMIYLMDASYVTFSGNTIRNGYCDNCNLAPGTFGPPHEVRGVEMDGDIWHEPNALHPEPRRLNTYVRHIRFVDNVLTNLTSTAFYHNYCQPQPGACPGWNTGPLSDIQLVRNQVTLTAGLVADAGVIGALVGDGIIVQQSSGSVIDRQQTVSYEQMDADLAPSRWASWSAGCADYSVGSYPGTPLHGAQVLRIRAGAGCALVCARSPAISVAGGQTVAVADWVRNGGFAGRNYLVFLNEAGVELGAAQVSAPLTAQTAWAFETATLLKGRAPAAAKYFALQFCVQGADVVVDHDFTGIGLGD